ncbi:MAG: methylated-DNA--[protein]-cysteine S-methyltransferase [Cyanobacteria bacterium P01_D01_bin.105]
MMTHEQHYHAILSRDRRFDGIFFVGVSSTGIYCRTVCTVKAPKSENCRFFQSAAAAEKAGYRPCLRCRPELAPGRSKVDTVERLAAAAASRIEAGALVKQSVSALAHSLGVSDRHLHRVLQQEFGVSPIQLAQTQRLLLAKQLLTDTHLTVAEIAFASGFSSVRRLNALFQQHYHLQPSSLRKRQPPSLREKKTTEQDFICCELAYRPPFDWASLLSFLQVRTVAGVEVIKDNTYARTVCIGKHRGWIRVSSISEQNKLRVELSSSLIAVILPILNRTKFLFDLAADPTAISIRLGELAKQHPGLRIPGAFDGFEVAVRAILGQQVTVKAATTLMARFVQAFGTPMTTPIEGLTHLTPTAAQIAEATPDDIGKLGIVSMRVKAIQAIAQALTHQTLRLDPHAPIATTVTQLKAFPGIGDWTAQYAAMRILADPDAFPAGDLMLQKALNSRKPKELLKIAESWRPWRAYAAMHVWKSVDSAKPHSNMKSKETTIRQETTVYFTWIQKSPVGEILLTSDGRSLTGLYLQGQKHFPLQTHTWEKSAVAEPFGLVKQQLIEYFSNQRQSFDLPLAAKGTEFQRSVWNLLPTIPYGETVSYGSLAQKLGKPGSSRAVGAANGRNPISIIVPCHRVIAANGKLTGYAGGIDRKQWLLAHEKGLFEQSTIHGLDDVQQTSLV